MPTSLAQLRADAIKIIDTATEQNLLYLYQKRRENNPNCPDLMDYGSYASTSLHHSQTITTKTLTRHKAQNIIKWYREARETASERGMQEQLEIDECLRDEPSNEELEADQASWEAKLRASEKVYEEYRDAAEAEARARAKSATQAKKITQPLPQTIPETLRCTRKETKKVVNTTDAPGAAKPHFTADERERLLAWMSAPHPTSGTNFVWTNKASKAQ